MIPLALMVLLIGLLKKPFEKVNFSLRKYGILVLQMDALIFNCSTSFF
jgi:hypothetical protein